MATIQLTPPPLQPQEPSGLQRLQARHYRIVELSLQGLTNIQIAEQMGMTPTGISLIVNSPVFQEELSRRRQQQNRGIDEVTAVGTVTVKAILEQGSIAAARKMVDLLSNTDPKIQQTSAKDILDRTFGGKMSEQAGKASVTVINIGQMNNLLQALQEDKQMQLASPATGTIPVVSTTSQAEPTQ